MIIRKILVAVTVVVMFCSCSFAEVKKISEKVNNLEKKFILSKAFDVSYDFHCERVGMMELKVFVHDETLRPSDGTYFDARSFIYAGFDGGDVRINIIRPEANKQYLLIRMFIDGTDVFENLDIKKYTRLEMIGGKRYYRLKPPKHANKEAENFAVYLLGVRGLNISRMKFSGTSGEEKASSMRIMFEEQDQAFKNSLIRKSITGAIILVLCILMLLVGRVNLLKQLSLRHFIGGFFATYVAAIGIISLIHRFIPRFYNEMMKVYTYLGNNLGVELLKNYKPYEIDWFLCVLVVALLIYFIATSKRELMAIILLPVMILLQFFVLMFTASSIQSVGYYIFLAVMVFLFIKYPSKGGISPKATLNKQQTYDTGNEYDFSGIYYDRDGHRYHYSYDTIYSGNRRIYIEDDDGVTIELWVDMNGNFFDKYNSIYYKSS